MAPDASVASGMPAAIAVVVDEAPDAVLDRVEARFTFEAERAGSLNSDRDDLLDLAGPAGEDNHAVGQIDRLVDLVGDEQHGLSGFRPNLQQLLLHRFSGLRIER